MVQLIVLIRLSKNIYQQCFIDFMLFYFYSYCNHFKKRLKFSTVHTKNVKVRQKTSDTERSIGFPPNVTIVFTAILKTTEGNSQLPVCVFVISKVSRRFPDKSIFYQFSKTVSEKLLFIFQFEFIFSFIDRYKGLFITYQREV